MLDRFFLIYALMTNGKVLISLNILKKLKNNHKFPNYKWGFNESIEKISYNIVVVYIVDESYE